VMGTRDYNAIADVLKRLSKYPRLKREKQLMLAVASELAGVFERGNPNFQRQRFMDATGTNQFIGLEDI
jgi:hypothetical protein